MSPAYLVKKFDFGGLRLEKTPILEPQIFLGLVYFSFHIYLYQKFDPLALTVSKFKSLVASFEVHPLF